MNLIGGGRMEAHVCLDCSYWMPQGTDVPTGYCKRLLYDDKSELKEAVKKYSDNCTNFAQKTARQDEAENDFPFL
jgi:hypothetical protein